MTNPAHQSLSDFFNSCLDLTYKKGDILLRPQDTPPGLYRLDKGYIKLYSISEGGDENILIIFKPGEMFPFTWAILDEDRDIFLEALTPVTVKRANKAEFIQLLHESATAAYETVVATTRMYDVFLARIHNLELSKAYPRLIARILSMSPRLGKRQDNTITFDLPITQQDIANSCAMTRETVTREMAKLEKKSLIEYKKKIICIPDIEKLEEEFRRHYYLERL